MSLIIKGIDLPKEDDFIALEIHKGEYRIYYTKGATIKEKRGEAIQIPTPHGRLIDGDELNKSVQKWNPVFTYGRSAFAREIDNAPTIIDAEE